MTSFVGTARAAAIGLATAASFTLVPVSAQTIVPQSALTPSTQYYTDTIGGGIGNVVVMTGGGNASGVGQPNGRNDDGFSGPISLGFTLNFFGTDYSSFFINNNGNISFGAGISAFVPTGLTGATAPVISPYFSDVDTRGPLSGVVHFRNDIANEIIVTWDNVGRYNGRDDLLNSFQLVVRGAAYQIPNGEGTIGFFYRDMPWITTDTSTTAAVGFGNGAGGFEALAGSNTSTINGVVANHFIWFDQNLVAVPVNPVPEPETYAMMLLGLAGLGAYTRRRRKQR